MNRVAINTFLSLLIVCSACNHVYREYDKEPFPTYRWPSGQKIIFKPTISDVTKSYKLTVGIRHLYAVLQADNIQITINAVSPSGKELTWNGRLQVKDPNNKYLSKCGGDYCDLETTVAAHVRFDEAGQYQITITHDVQQSIDGIMEVGLIIDED